MIIKDEKDLEKFVMNALEAPTGRVKVGSQLNGMMQRAKALNRQNLNRRITEQRNR